MQTALLVGASPLGSACLAALDIPFVLVVRRGTEAAEVTGTVLDVVECDFGSDPLGVLSAVPWRRDFRVSLSFTENGLLPASVFGAAYDIPSVDVRAVLRTRNKWLMRQVLAHERPAYGLTGGAAEVSGSLAPNSSVVVKPVDGTASVGVDVIIDGGLPPASSKELLWEELVVGREFSVETVSYDGRHDLLGITRKVTSGPPRFVELMHSTDHGLSPPEVQVVTTFVSSVLDGLGIANGPGHTEILVSQDGVVLIESHTRPGGDRIPLITELVSGRNQIMETVLSVSHLAGPPAALAPSYAVATSTFVGSARMRISAASLRLARGLPDVVEVIVNGHPSSHTDEYEVRRSVCVVAGGATSQDAAEATAEAVTMLSSTMA